MEIDVNFGLRNSTTFIKTILIILVILGHSMAFWSGEWFTCNPVYHSDLLNHIFKWLGSFHTYALVLVSGYIFAFKMDRGDYLDYGKFTVKKLKRLIVPYWTVALIWVIPITYIFFNNIKKIFFDFILCSSPNQLWFLWMLFWIFLVTHFLYTKFKSLFLNITFGVFFCGVLYMIGIVGNMLTLNIFCIWSSFQYFFSFYIGIIIRNREEKGKGFLITKHSWIFWGFIDCLLFSVCTLLEKYDSNIFKIVYHLLLMFLHVAGALFAYTFLQYIAKRFYDNKIIKKLAITSMPMYLFHQQLIYFSIYVFNGVVNPYINTIVNFLFALIGSYLLSAFLLKFKLTRFLLGEK